MRFRPTHGLRGRRRLGRWATLALALVLGTGGLAVGAPTAAAADPTASMSIQKSASDTTVTPGQDFIYTLQFQCTAGEVNGCVNAVVDDPMPDYITITGPPTVTGTANYDASGSTSDELIITFTDNLGGGQTGLAPGNVVTVQVPVHVDEDAPPAADGTVLTNTSTITADNANQKQGSADVTLNVPSTLAASTSKTIDPSTGPNVAGTTTNASITGTNTSNVPVNQLVITDPVLDADGNPPDTAINPLTYLELSGLTSLDYPTNAETVQLRVYDTTTGEWVDGPVVTKPAAPTLPIPAENVGAVQLIFTSTDDPGIQPGESGGVDVVLALKNAFPEEDLPFVITNYADTTVTDADGNSATSPPASDDYRTPPNEIDVTAGKSFDPAVVHAGDPSTVTLTGTNSGDDPLESMTITEPAPVTPNHFADGSWTYTPSSNAVVFPTGAQAGTVTFSCNGTAAPPLELTNNQPLPDPNCSPVTGFSVTFTGTIGAGAQATVPFEITTDPDQDVEEQYRLNVVRVTGDRDGITGGDNALAVIETIKDRIKVDVDKSLYPSTIPSYPGQIITASLSGGLLPFPDSTVDASQIIVQDPSTIPDPNQWYDSFDPEAVTATSVPSCASLTVQYTVDGTNWLDVPGMTDIHGATIFNGVFPDDVKADAIGVRFVYTADPAGGGCEGGFPPGTSVAPNLSYSLDADGPNVAEGTYTNCAGSAASSATTPDATAGPACDTVDLTPVDPGSIDPIDKSWSPSTVLQRSQANTTVTLSWSTQGFTGTGRIDISDTQNPDTTAIADSAFDTFDLTKINPITATDDPWLTYDQISKVQLYLLPSATSTDPAAGSWVDATNDPCPAACDGTFPGYTLTGPEVQRAIGFRLSYVESPTRVDRLGGPTAPPVGSGVAASTGNDRHIHANFQLRDVRRSDPSVPVTSDQVYNVAAEDGVVHNTVRLDPYWNVDDTTPIMTVTDGADIKILPSPLFVQGTKSWDGGPLGIPQPGVPQSDYPTSNVTVTGSNATPSKVDELTITDPDTSDQGGGSCQTNPFDSFTLTTFTGITDPAAIGASGATLTVTHEDTSTTDYTRTEALSLTPAQLADVIGWKITYTGRINAANPDPVTATVKFSVQLREFTRGSTTDRPEPGTVCNQSKSKIRDMVDNDDYTETQDAYSNADIQLVPQGIDVVAGKSFDPTTLTEPSHGPVKVTLSGQPVSPEDASAVPPSRAVQLVLEDSSTTFFNQYDFESFNDLTYVTPVDQVQVDAYVGGTWSLDAGEPVLTGGNWVTGQPTQGTTLSLPGTVTKEQVQGLRFTFTRSDGANWENPANPTQTSASTCCVATP